MIYNVIWSVVFCVTIVSTEPNFQNLQDLIPVSQPYAGKTAKIISEFDLNGETIYGIEWKIVNPSSSDRVLYVIFRDPPAYGYGAGYDAAKIGLDYTDVETRLYINNLADADIKQYTITLSYNNGADSITDEIEFGLFSDSHFLCDGDQPLTINGDQHICEDIEALEVPITVGDSVTVELVEFDASINVPQINFVARIDGEQNVTGTCDSDSCTVTVVVNEAGEKQLFLDYSYGDVSVSTFTTLVTDIIPPPWLHVGGIVSISFSCASLVAMIIVITVLAVKDKLKKLHLWICCGVCAGVIVIFMFVAGFTSNDADPQVETDNLIRSLSICAACLVGVIIVTIVTYFVYDWCPKDQQNKKDQSSNRGQSASRSTGQVSPHFSNSESGDKTNGSRVVTPPSAMQPLAIMSTVAVTSPRKLPPLNSAKSPDDPADDVEEEEQRKKKKKKKKRKHRDVEDGEMMST